VEKSKEIVANREKSFPKNESSKEIATYRCSDLDQETKEETNRKTSMVESNVFDIPGPQKGKSCHVQNGTDTQSARIGQGIVSEKGTSYSLPWKDTTEHSIRSVNGK
jgi:hypothetical protein